MLRGGQVTPTNIGQSERFFQQFCKLQQTIKKYPEFYRMIGILKQLIVENNAANAIGVATPYFFQWQFPSKNPIEFQSIPKGSISKTY